MTPFTPMASLIAPASLGIAKVDHFTLEKSPVRGLFRPSEYISPGEYVRLFVNGTLFMSDTDYEKRTNYGFIRAARGDVLIAGLGIGMVLVPTLAKAEVRSVTVLEKHPDVANLITPSLDGLPGREKLSVVVADVFTWKLPKGHAWDTIYFDIWADQSTDDLAEMATLHRRFARRKRPGGWMASWRMDELRYRRSQEKRRGW